mmetsp:Transcript_64827/g.198247  ORF Transcript_64827/g.198247 Transcript_64827/m.198247 type:complete len:405 (-) Transcript_64827:573-1787(-)
MHQLPDDGALGAVVLLDQHHEGAPAFEFCDFLTLHCEIPDGFDLSDDLVDIRIGILPHEAHLAIPAAAEVEQANLPPRHEGQRQDRNQEHIEWCHRVDNVRVGEDGRGLGNHLPGHAQELVFQRVRVALQAAEEGAGGVQIEVRHVLFQKGFQRSDLDRLPEHALCTALEEPGREPAPQHQHHPTAEPLPGQDHNPVEVHLALGQHPQKVRRERACEQLRHHDLEEGVEHHGNDPGRQCRRNETPNQPCVRPAILADAAQDIVRPREKLGVCDVRKELHSTSSVPVAPHELEDLLQLLPAVVRRKARRVAWRGVRRVRHTACLQRLRNALLQLRRHAFAQHLLQVEAALPLGVGEPVLPGHALLVDLVHDQAEDAPSFRRHALEFEHRREVSFARAAQGAIYVL